MKDATDILVVTAPVVSKALLGREVAIMDAVRFAYELHARGESILPNSVFLRLPGADGNRIIGLPAQLGGEGPIVGMKWIASFPQNNERGIDRASALLVLNNSNTGRPVALLEASTISAVRTAASASLASQMLAKPGVLDCLGVVGCGRISFETVRFLQVVHPELCSLVIYDIAQGRQEAFAAKCRQTWPNLAVYGSKSIQELSDQVHLLVFATTSGVPHVSDIRVFQPGSVVLHLSLRDLAPEVILAADNVVDDIDHVCRENTSVHLAEVRSGNRSFIRSSLGDILVGKAKGRAADKDLTVFSPFGLGILDLAVAKFVLDAAKAGGECLVVESFLPSHWTA